MKIITVADLHWRNGLEYGLQALQIVVQRGIRPYYTIMGEGPFLEAVGFARHELGLKEFVDIVPTPVKEVSREIYENSDLFLLPAVAAGTNNGLAGAFDHGLKIICTDVPNLIPDRLDRPAIAVVPRRDPKALADAIMLLQSN